MGQSRYYRNGCRCPGCGERIRNGWTFTDAGQPVICAHCSASLREIAPLSFLRPLLTWIMLIGVAITWPVAMLTGFWFESAILFAGLAPVVWMLTRLTRYERVAPPTHCLDCQYDLRAAAVSHSNACPECGHIIVPDQQLLIAAKYLPPAADDPGLGHTRNAALGHTRNAAS